MFVLARLISLDHEKVLLVKGPALVTCEGSVTVLGKEVTDVSVRAGKILPFEADGMAKVKVKIYPHGSYRISKHGSVGVSIWKDVSDRIEGIKRIMLVGATDTGKSTLTTYLSNFANSNGSKVGILDGDVGQGDIAPPGSIGAAVVNEQFLDLRDIDAEYYAFIGSNSPMGTEKLVIDNMLHLLDKISESDICIINTDGYVDETICEIL